MNYTQRGAVLIIALFIMALVATMSYVMMARLSRDVIRTDLLLQNARAELYAQGSIAWAIDQLNNNWLQQKPKQLIDTLPLKSPTNEENGYQITSTLTDAQAYFNINTLKNADAAADFKRLLQYVSPLSDEKAQAIVEAVVDWISPAGQTNTVNPYYAEASPPYRPAHRLMVSASELALVKGVTSELYNHLKPYIIALPTMTQINVQTAPAEVLLTISPNMTIDLAQAIEKARIKEPFTSPTDFANLDMVKNHQITGDKINVTSQYFLLETEVKIEKQTVLLYTLLNRVIKDAKSSINIIWQSKGIPG